MLAPEQVIPTFRVVMPKIQRVPLTTTHISEQADGLLHIAGVRRIVLGEREGVKQFLNSAFIFNRVSPKERVKNWEGKNGESIVWLSSDRFDGDTAYIEQSEIIGLNAHGDALFYRQKVNANRVGEDGFELEPKRFFLRWGSTGRELQFRSNLEPLAIDDKKRILLASHLPGVNKTVTNILSDNKAIFLRYRSETDADAIRNKIIALAPNGDILLEVKCDKDFHPMDGASIVYRLRNGGFESYEPVLKIDRAASVTLGGSLLFGKEDNFTDKDGINATEAVIYITDDGKKGGLYAPGNCGRAIATDSILVNSPDVNQSYYFIGGGCTNSCDGLIWVLTEDQANTGEPEVGFNLSDFATSEVQLGYVKQITPRGILLTKATTVPGGQQSAILIPSSLEQSGADWGD